MDAEKNTHPHEIRLQYNTHQESLIKYTITCNKFTANAYYTHQERLKEYTATCYTFTAYDYYTHQESLKEYSYM